MFVNFKELLLKQFFDINCVELQNDNPFNHKGIQGLSF